jgi:hypothetical protein
METLSGFAFWFCAVCRQRRLLFTRRFPLLTLQFRPNRPSSGVQVVVMKESAGHCNIARDNWLLRNAGNHLQNKRYHN